MPRADGGPLSMYAIKTLTDKRIRTTTVAGDITTNSLQLKNIRTTVFKRYIVQEKYSTRHRGIASKPATLSLSQVDKKQNKMMNRSSKCAVE